MAEWLGAMTALQRAFAYAALAGSFALVIQFVLLLVGLGEDGDADSADTSGLDHDDGLEFGHMHGPDCDHDFDMDDLDMDSDHDAAAHVGHDALRPFTVRGMVAFLAIFGWSGLILLKMGIPTFLSVMLGTGAGMLAMVLMAVAFRAMYGMQASGNLDVRNARGAEATVYITIPPDRSGQGKVTMLLQERFAELSAVTDSSRAIPTGERVIVTGSDGDAVVVAPRAEQKN